VKADTANRRRIWLGNVASFTVAGLAASILVGGSLGYLGTSLGLDGTGNVAIAIVVAVIVTASARELGLRAVPLLQARRQTAGIWARRLGPRKAAVLWGIDLGLFVTTWQSLAGAWLVPVLALLAASPGFGALLFASYWLGRASSVWVAPLLAPAAAGIPELMQALADSRRASRYVHVGALGWAAVIVIAIAGQGGSV
jgi:hypothetical protein